MAAATHQALLVTERPASTDEWPVPEAGRELMHIPDFQGTERGSCRTVCRLDPSKSADSDEETLSNVEDAELPIRIRPSFLVMTMVVATLALVAFGEARSWGRESQSTGPDTPGKRLNAASPARTLLQSPELTNLIVAEARRHVDAAIPEDRLRNPIRALLRSFGNVLDQHLGASERLALHYANIDAETWQDMGRMFGAIRDTRLASLGRHAFNVVRNASATEQDIKNVLTGEFRARRDDFDQKAKLLPPRVVTALQQYSSRDAAQAPRLGLWDALARAPAEPASSQEHVQQSSVVSQPVDSVASHVRALERRSHQERALHAAFLERALQADPGADAGDDQDPMTLDKWLNPDDLTGGELGISITAIVMVLILEVFVHLEIFVSGFSLPLWVWGLLVTPTSATSWMTCAAGLTIWCEIIFGAVGLNLLEESVVLLFSIGSPTESPYWAKQEDIEEQRT